MNHDLLNNILRAIPRLTVPELQMLLDVTRKAQETAEAGDPGLLMRNLNSPPPPPELEGLLAKDSEGI